MCRFRSLCSLDLAGFSDRLLEATGGKLKLPTYTQEFLVAGLSVWNDRFDKYSEADHRITRLSRSLESILHPPNGTGGTNKKR